jgi:hypothetical protein
VLRVDQLIGDLAELFVVFPFLFLFFLWGFLVPEKEARLALVLFF